MDGNDRYVGRILDNRYEIIELIGTGGMALVYRARCHRLNRMVAIKILKEDLAGDDEFRRRFHTESQAVAMLSHPNIVAVYDVSRSGNIEYIVMELIEGITLKQYINRKGLLNWKEALHFATQVTKALSHAHSRGIIHRDIKPHNIMILKDGSVKVADFGIARLLTMQNTMTQEALGSVHYISPEQAKGGYVDARCDIYSVGVVMYEMLTSRLPFVGESAVSIAIQHISAIPLMPSDINPDVPSGLESITMRAMEPDLRQRFMTAEEMLHDLEEFRKNPAIRFNYAVVESGQYDRDSSSSSSIPDLSIVEDTKVMIPVNRVRTDLPKPRSFPLPGGQSPPKKPDMTADEHRAVKKRASSTSILIGVFGIVVFLVVVFIFMWNYFLKDFFGSPESNAIIIPNFVGRLEDSVLRDNEYRDLYEFTVVRMPSDEHDEGIVISQRPEAEHERPAPSADNKINVELTVSAGARDIPQGEMPNLIDMLVTMAVNRLQSELGNLNLEILQEPVVSEDVPRNYVIETLPRAGENVTRGFQVIIYYSVGPEITMIEVPNLVGSTEAELLAAFENSNLIPEIEYYTNTTVEEGIVTYINRRGESVPEGTIIIVHVSSGPPELPTVAIPDLLGSTRVNLESTFASLGLIANIIEVADIAPLGTVVSIANIGEEVPPGTSVNVQISAGPPEPDPFQPFNPLPPVDGTDPTPQDPTNVQE